MYRVLIEEIILLLKFRLENRTKMKIPESNRYEIKMLTEHLMLPQIRSWLQVHPAAFYKPYPDRQVNNVYFDTPHLLSFAENISGVSERRKIRLRWYGEDTTKIQGILEVKCKRNFHGWKKSQKLSNPLNLKETSWVDLSALISSDLTEDMKLHWNSFLLPVLLNQYQREYYLSFDGKVRITIDFSQLVYNQSLSAFPNLSFSVPPSDNVVVEVKANITYRERLAEIIADIPLRVGKKL